MPIQLTYRQSSSDFRRARLRFCKENFAGIFNGAIFSSLFVRRALDYLILTLIGVGLTRPALSLFPVLYRLNFWTSWAALFLLYYGLTYWYATNSMRRFFFSLKEKAMDVTITLREDGLIWKGAMNRLFIPWSGVRTIRLVGSSLIIDTTPPNFGPICIFAGGTVTIDELARWQERIDAARSGRLPANDEEEEAIPGTWPPLPNHQAIPLSFDGGVEKTLIGQLVVIRSEQRLELRRRRDMQIYSGIVDLVIGVAAGAIYFTARLHSHSILPVVSFIIAVGGLLFAYFNLRKGEPIYLDKNQGVYRMQNGRLKPLENLQAIEVRPNGKMFMLWFVPRIGKPEPLMTLASNYKDGANADELARLIGDFTDLPIRLAQAAEIAFADEPAAEQPLVR